MNTHTHMTSWLATILIIVMYNYNVYHTVIINLVVVYAFSGPCVVLVSLFSFTSHNVTTKIREKCCLEVNSSSDIISPIRPWQGLCQSLTGYLHCWTTSFDDDTCDMEVSVLAVCIP